MSRPEDLVRKLFEVDERIRYVATMLDGAVESRARAGIETKSFSDFDGHEEVHVNPAVLDLVRRRGSADPGGARFIVIRFGHFWQLAMACRGGHVSIGIDLDGDPLEVAAVVSDLLLENGL